MTAEEHKYIEKIYLELYDFLLSYAISFLKDPDVAEEALQETFRVVCTKPEEMLSSPNPKGWIIKTLKNTMFNIRRTRANGTRLLADYAACNQDSACSQDQLPLEVTYENVARTEEFQLLKEMAVDGSSHQEMARKRGISVNACKKRVQRAKELLRRKI